MPIVTIKTENNQQPVQLFPLTPTAIRRILAQNAANAIPEKPAPDAS